MLVRPVQQLMRNTIAVDPRMTTCGVVKMWERLKYIGDVKGTVDWQRCGAEIGGANSLRGRRREEVCRLRVQCMIWRSPSCKRVACICLTPTLKSQSDIISCYLHSAQF